MKRQLRIIFGAGNKGRILLRTLGKADAVEGVHCFIDSDPARWGSTVEGVPVRQPGYLLTLPLHSFKVFVAVGPGYPEVCDLLTGYGLTGDVDFVDARINPISHVEIDDEFRRIRDLIRGYTLLSDDRLQHLHQFARAAAHLPGEAAEVGVYRGGTAYLLASIFSVQNKVLRLFDTFSGVPAIPASIDIHREGDFSDASIAEVTKYLDGFANIVFHVGIFPDSVTADADSNTYCFVHVDADIYRSVIDSCIFFYPRLTPGGMMLFDDYGFPSCPGVRKAVDEYFSDKRQKPIYLPTGQALIINS